MAYQLIVLRNARRIHQMALGDVQYNTVVVSQFCHQFYRVSQILNTVQSALQKFSPWPSSTIRSEKNTSRVTALHQLRCNQKCQRRKQKCRIQRREPPKIRLPPKRPRRENPSTPRRTKTSMLSLASTRSLPRWMASCWPTTTCRSWRDSALI